jgi:DNA-binding NarL/FixJ family response regulator
VVEDFARFRQLICSTLATRPDLRIVCEVADGLQAVQKAEVLKPDLVLLDIGLPTLNGIEAARQIRKLAPKSEIIFLSQESSPDVVQEALNSGGAGLRCEDKGCNRSAGCCRSDPRGQSFCQRRIVGSELH